ncbi:hypothetical protein MNKW57_10960 [Biformimicrobium ophioploci]|uniref:Uncharacterized protein n=1 Tax=Biformimicrobium ophioploci TaxID=3036711 RepID=A0ABQ6LXH2_9GAMM|nr:hypothetical protein MNKW57_10960 [Microbulbifer sp. NKW57]
MDDFLEHDAEQGEDTDADKEVFEHGGNPVRVGEADFKLNGVRAYSSAPILSRNLQGSEPTDVWVRDDWGQSHGSDPIGSIDGVN